MSVRDDRPEHLARLEAERQRIERELAEQEPERPAPFTGLRAKRDMKKPRRSSRTTFTVLLARLDRLNLMARNPGWSLLILLTFTAVASAETCRTTKDGKWSSDCVWKPHVPTALDNAEIWHSIIGDSGVAKQVTVTKDASLHIHGKLDLHDGSLIWYGKLTGDEGTVALHVTDDRLFTGNAKPGPVPGEPDFHPDDYGLWAMPGSTTDLDAGEFTSWAKCTPLTQQVPVEYGLFASSAFVDGKCTLDRDLIGWAVGDSILLTNEKGQYATATLAAIDGRSITYKDADAFTGSVLLHGEKDIDPAVANLSRRLKIVSALVKEGDTNHRAHCAFLHGATVRMRGVEFRNLGPRGKLGRYPIHWHMGGATTGSLDSCSIWQDVTEPGNRFVALHHVRGVEVTNNVAFRSRGHGYFFEDRHEVGNKLLGNLSVAVEAGEELPNVDSTVTPLTHHFWVRVGNEISGNVAIGGDALGLVVLGACPSCVAEFKPADGRHVITGQECLGVGKYGMWSMVPNVDFKDCTGAYCQLAGFAADPTWGNSSEGVRVLDSLLAMNGNASTDPYISQAYLNQAKGLVFERTAMLGKKGIHTHYNVTFSAVDCTLNNQVWHTPTYWDHAGDFRDCRIDFATPFDRAYPVSRYTLGCTLVRDCRMNGGDVESFDLVGKAAARYGITGAAFGEGLKTADPLPQAGLVRVTRPGVKNWRVVRASDEFSGNVLTTNLIEEKAWAAWADWLGYGVGLPPGKYKAQLYSAANAPMGEVGFEVVSGKVTDVP